MKAAAGRPNTDWDTTNASVARCVQSALGLPFDVTRELYAKAVHFGWLPGSILASRDLERALSALEQVSLGPWARRV